MDAAKKTVSSKIAAVALLFLLSLSIAENLGAPVSIAPNQTQASATHYNYNSSFNVTLFANATVGDLVECNASITLADNRINFTSPMPGQSNRTYIGNVSNQTVANNSWELVALGRGAHYLNFSLACNGSSIIPANTTIFVDLLNITNVSLTTPYSIKWNDSYHEVYRNASYNISITVARIGTEELTNARVYLNDTSLGAFTLNTSTPNNTTLFQSYTANAPVGAMTEYTVTTNDSQNDRWEQPLVIQVISPLNVTISYNDTAIVANQSFTATATARNLGPLNLTGINLTVQTDGGLVLTNTSCGLFTLSPATTNTSCAWTFNSTLPNAKANITINALSLEGDSNANVFGNKIYGIGSFTTNTSISFGLYNHTAGTVVQTVNLSADASEDLVNFNCAAAGDLNASISCQSLSSLPKSNASTYNILLAIPQYTSKGMHYGNISIYSENANPQNATYSVNITGMKKCSLTSPASAARAISSLTTGFASVNITNQGNVNITTVSCGGIGCNQIQSPSSPLTPGNSAIYNLSATTSALSTTYTTFLVNCTSSDADAIDGGTSNTLTITHPSGEAAVNTNQNTNTNTNSNNQAPPSNATTYTYTVGILPATKTIEKGYSAEFTIEIKNTGTGTLTNLTISGESDLQFSVTPTKITSIPKGQAGYSKITVTTTTATLPADYKVKAKACRTTTSCVTSSESIITIPADAPAAAPPANTSKLNHTTAAPASKNKNLTVTTSDNALKLQLENTNNATAYVEVLDSSGKVVYNRTGHVNGTEYAAIIPETLKAGNYTLRVLVKDFAGNTIAEKSLTYTAKAHEQKTDTITAATPLLTPSTINVLLVIIMALFIIAGIKTSKIGGTIKSTLNIRQKIMDKAHTAYQQGEYGKAREYRTAAESATSTERELMKKIGESERKILSLYREGRHLQARKEQENLSRMKKELEVLREQHRA